MDVCGVCVIFALSLVFAISSAHIASHDNILRIQLWDAEGLSKNPEPTAAPVTVHKHTHKSHVDLDTLYHAMLDEAYGNTDTSSRFTRHKVRHKRRRSRESGDDSPWKFHDGIKSLNVGVYDNDTPWDVIEGRAGPGGSAVQSDQSAKIPANEGRQVGPPMTLRQDEEMAMKVMSVAQSKHLP